MLQNIPAKFINIILLLYKSGSIVLNIAAIDIATYITVVPEEAFNLLPVWPKDALVITAIIIVVKAPVVKAWIETVLGIIFHSIDKPNSIKAITSQAYPKWSIHTSGSEVTVQLFQFNNLKKWRNPAIILK